MDTINELAADERTARIILAVASEPGDAVTGRMIRTVGASETIARALADEVPPGPDGDTWQRRLAPRIDAAQTRRVLAETERHGMRVLIPGDAEWSAGIDTLGDRAPVALWAKGNTGLLSRPVWDRLTVTGARASTGYGEHVTTELVQSAVADTRVVLSGGAGDPVELSVTDYGPGIPPEHVPRITERFYRVNVEASRSKKGTGLGLAIVNHILTRHRARLVVKSEVGKGTVFTVRF